MMTKTRWVTAAIATTAATALAVPRGYAFADEAASCEVEALPGADDADAGPEATAVSDDAQYVGGVLPGSEALQPVLWHGEDIIEITDTAAVYAEVDDVNAEGATVGASAAGDDDPFQPWVYRDGQLAELTGPIDGWQVRAHAIADDGTIVGTTQGDPEDSEVENSLPLLWQPGETAGETLAMEDAISGQTRDIYSDGTVLGSVVNEAAEEESWTWNAADGSYTVLDPLPGTVAPVKQLAGDWALGSAGESSDPADQDHFRWDSSQDGDAQQLELETSYGIDSSGRVFGTTDGQQPAVQLADEILEMPKLEENPEDALDTYVLDSTPDGSTVVGTALTGDGHRPIAWTCQY